MRRGYGGCWRDLAVLLYKEIERVQGGRVGVNDIPRKSVQRSGELAGNWMKLVW